MGARIDITDERDSPADFVAVSPQHGHNVRLASKFIVVLSCGPAGDWAAYFGPATWSLERVAAYGDKLPREAAMIMFPNVRGRYRD